MYAIVASIFIALICIYSLVNPSDSSGTTTSHHFINSIIVYTALNVLVMNKLFQLSFSLYRLAIVAVQLGCIYLGFIIISSVSSELQGIIWYLFQGKMFLTAVTVVWICLAFAYARRLWISLPDIKKRFKITK